MIRRALSLTLFLTAILALATTQHSCAVDPGPTLPILRRTTTANQPKAPKTPADQANAKATDAPPRTDNADSPQEVDTAEVIRRGDRVVISGRGPMGLEDGMISDATSPPPDDSHKWFFSIIVDDSRDSQALLYDLAHSQELRAWMNVDEPKQSWSHVTKYVAKDQTQDWRWSKIAISKLPVMILQPPASLRDKNDPKSWEWGDPSVVVCQWDGYEATKPNRAKLRSDEIRSVLTMYVRKIAERRAQDQLVGPRSRAASPRATAGARQSATPGAGQDVGAPPFSLPATPSSPATNPFAENPPTPGPQPLPVNPGIVDLVGLILGKVFGPQASGAWLALLAALKVFELIAARTHNKVDDQIVGGVRSIVNTIASPSQPTT